MSHRMIQGLLAGLLVSACGCGGTATVSGKVTYRGRPVTAGSVIFVSADQVSRFGVIQPDGSYTVDGVHPGEVKVAVISRDPAKTRSVLQGGKPARPGKKNAPAPPTAGGWFPIPRQFEDPETAGLACTLGAGQITHDIDLKAAR
jgi:hypothetical protein